jgi:hypothetical protein
VTVTGTHYNWGWAYGGDNGIFWSVEYNFPPTFAAAQTSLSMADRDGLVTGGITHTVDAQRRAGKTTTRGIRISAFLPPFTTLSPPV